MTRRSDERTRTVVVLVVTLVFFVAVGIGAFVRPGGGNSSTTPIRGCDVVMSPSVGTVTTCPDADLAGVDLATKDLRLADLSGARLRGADLAESVVYGADLRGADLRGADLRGADLHEADLRGADLRGADLSDSDLTDADLREATIVGAHFSSAKIAGMRVAGTTLELADQTRTSADGGPVRVGYGIQLADGLASTSCLREQMFRVGTTDVRCRITTDARTGGRLDQTASVTVRDGRAGSDTAGR